jgi:hypothetical protein
LTFDSFEVRTVQTNGQVFFGGFFGFVHCGGFAVRSLFPVRNR